MSDKKTILVDMDSVIADFYWGVMNRYAEDSGDDSLPPHYMDKWDTTFPNGKDSFAYFSQPGFFRSLKPIPGAHDVLKRYHDRGHEIVIASAATLTNAPGEKFEWLTEHYPWLSRDRVFFGKEKWRIRGDVFIDDHAVNARGYRKHNPDTFIIGIEYPYNLASRADFDSLVDSYQRFGNAWASIDEWIQHYLDFGLEEIRR